MRKKDYIQIEDAIQRFISVNPEIEPYASKLINIFSKQLKEDNPKFNEKKFMLRYQRNIK